MYCNIVSRYNFWILLMCDIIVCVHQHQSSLRLIIILKRFYILFCINNDRQLGILRFNDLHN